MSINQYVFEKIARFRWTHKYIIKAFEYLQNTGYGYYLINYYDYREFDKIMSPSPPRIVLEQMSRFPNCITVPISISRMCR